MNGTSSRAVLAAAALFGALVTPAMSAAAPTSTAAQVAAPDDKIAAGLERRFERSAGQPQDFWVSFDETADTSDARAIDDWAARGESVVDRLRETAATSQTDVVELLDSAGVDYAAYWVVNAIRIESGPYELALSLAGQPDVERVFAPVAYEAVEPVEQRASASRTGTHAPASVEWGLQNVKADQAWQQYGVRGDEIVVANIDSGVQFDHPALVESYRGNNGDGTFSNDYNWFDATGQSDYPSDNNGHGTHTMGTMVGDDGAANQIGMAPGATWIAANGCASCSDDDLIASAQWMLAPTRIDGTDPDPAMRPNIVNNSWGSIAPSNDPFMEDVLTAWADSGIFGVWANGNIGPGCATAGSPGSRILNYSVGAYDSTNTIASFSSRGAGQDGETKPNISAPGASVRSSVPGSYAVVSGTSMATPHVAGAVALLWSADPALVGDIAATRQLLDDTATDTPDDQCGGTDDDNNVYGEGRLDALALVEATDQGETGTLAGAVTHDETGDPVRGVTIRLAAGDLVRSTRSNDGGGYTVDVPAGQYEATATAFGYEPATVTLDVTAGQTTTADIQLTAVVGFDVTGTVVDKRTGRGIPGVRITLAGTRFSATSTVDGGFTVPNVPGPQSYVATIDGGGCTRPVHRTLTIDQDTSLPTFELTRITDTPNGPGWGWGPPTGISCILEPTQWIRGDTEITVPEWLDHTKLRLPFEFTYFGRQYRDLLVSTRGIASFWRLEEWIPGSEDPQLLYGIWAFNDVRLFDEQSGMFTRSRGTAPNRTFTVEWRDVTRLGQPDVRYSFEVTLHENGDIVLAYKDIDDHLFAERGLYGEVGLQDNLPGQNLVYRTKFEYSSFEAVLDDDRQIRFTMPPNGFLAGQVTDQKTGKPVAGADVDVIDHLGNRVARLQTDALGRYRAQLLVGRSYSVRVLAPPNYAVPPAATVRLTKDRQVRNLHTAVRSGRFGVDPGGVTIRPGKPGIVDLTNTGSTSLTWRAETSRPTPSRPARGTELASNHNDQGILLGVEEVDGSYWVTGVDYRQSQPWKFTEITAAGQPTGASIAPDDLAERFGLPPAQVTPGDLAWVPSRGWMCMIFVNRIDDIACVDPETSEVQAVIDTDFVDDVASAGLAYDPETDRFFVLARSPRGGHQVRVRTLTGVDHPEVGRVLNTCLTARGSGGLAWDPATRSLWTNSTFDLMQMHPATCAYVSSVRPDYSQGIGSNGLDLDSDGDVISTFAFSDVLSEVVTTDPAPTPLRWLTISTSSGSLKVGAEQRLRLTVDWAMVPDGVTAAQLVLRGNGGPRAKVTIPITLRR